MYDEMSNKRNPFVMFNVWSASFCTGPRPRNCYGARPMRLPRSANGSLHNEREREKDVVELL